MPKHLLTLLTLTLSATALAEVRVEGALTHTPLAAPGETVSGTLVLTNPDETPARAKLSLIDYAFFADGQTHYNAPGTTAYSNASWITLEREDVTVPAKSRIEVRYTITVPRNTTGTYWSVIQVQPALPAPTPGVVQQRMNYLVQIVTDLGGDAAPKLNFSNPQLTRTPGGPLTFTVDFANEGTRWMIPKLTLEVFDAQGRSVATLTGRTRRVYPTTSLREAFPLTLPPGTYLLEVVADDGEKGFGARYTIEVK